MESRYFLLKNNYRSALLLVGCGQTSMEAPLALAMILMQGGVLPYTIWANSTHISGQSHTQGGGGTYQCQTNGER